MPASPIRWKKQEIEWLWCTILAWLHLTDVPEQHEDGCLGKISNPCTPTVSCLYRLLCCCCFFQYYTWKLKLRGFSRLFLILYLPSNDHVEKCVNEHESHCPGNAESVDWRGWLHCSAHLETNIVLLQPEQHLHSETHARVGEDTRGKKHSSVYYMQGVGNDQLMGKKWTYGVAGNFQGVQFFCG